MKTTGKLKNGLVVALALVILLSSMGNIVEAARFKDVSKEKMEWAYKDIERVAELGYMQGISSDEFAPAKSLTFEETIVLLGRFTNPTDDEKKKANDEYGGYLDGLRLSDWVQGRAKEDMAVAMYKGIVSKAEMENVNDYNRMDKAITKVATSVFLVRAMGLTGEAEDKDMVSLTYRDALEMSTAEMKYLSVLIEADILDPKGDGEGYFKPKSDLRRDVMAKMLSTSYDYLDKNPTKPVEPPKPEEPEEPEEETASKNGIVVNPRTYIENEEFIIIEEENLGEQLYQLGDETEVTLDGKTASKGDLKVGQEVDLTVKKGTREIISIKATTINMDISGKITAINPSSNKLTIEHSVDNKTVSGEYPVDKDASVFLDSRSAELEDLKEDDKVDLMIKSGVIEDIQAYSKSLKIEGIIKDLVEVKDSQGKEYNISIEDPRDKENLYTFLINSDTIIYKDNEKTTEIRDLMLKDEAYIEAEYGVVVEIDSNLVRRRIEGVIASLTTRLNAKPEITILNKETKKEEKYELAQIPFIRVDRKITNTSELKVGYYVDVLIEGEKILEIDADSRAAEATIMGTVTYINARNNEMEISIENFNLDTGKYGDRIMVYLKDNPAIVDNLFVPIRSEDIRRGDRVNVVGSYDGTSIIADTIQVR